jgi:hypothetical protein
MVILSAVVTGSIFLLSGQVGRVWGRDVTMADIFFAMRFGEGRVWEAGPRFQERGCSRSTRGVETRHRGPSWGRSVRGRGSGGASRGFFRLGFLG